MKKSIEGGRKIIYLLLFFVVLFSYDFCELSIAVASPDMGIESLKRYPSLTEAFKEHAFENASENVPNNMPTKSSPVMIPCKGINHVRTTRKVVALTFDDGPHKKYTEEILDVLRANDIRATFFFIGKNVDEYPDVVRDVYEDGHIIGNHTYSHSQLSSLSGEEIETELVRASRSIAKIIGFYPMFFRPPYGACSMKSIRVARNLGLKTIMWSAMVDDYRVNRTTPEKIAIDILKLVRPGTIIGLHDGGGNREKTVAALTIIIRDLKIQGYEFLTLPEMLHGEEYYD